MNAPAPLPEEADLPVRPGDVLARSYRVERVIGRGAAGFVVEARHVARDERVAVKLLLPEYSQNTETAARFLREAQAAARLAGEHVARVSEAGTLETGAPYVAMELLAGLDLADALERRGVFPIDDAVDHVLQACDALAEAHALGIVHRDLKPTNLFLAQRPDGTPLIKVLDFGLANGPEGDAGALADEAAGEGLYLAPEQMQPASGVDHRADIYALGITLYELLAGRQPFIATTLEGLRAEVLTGTPTPIRLLRADVPDALAAALERAYARDREQRYPNVAAFAAALAPFAPARSQASLDGIARRVGLSPAVAGARPPGGPASDLPPRAVGFAPGWAPPAAQVSVPLFSVPIEIPVVDYQAPMSRRAAAAFAAGATPMPGLPRAGGRLGGSSGMLAIVAAIAIGTGLLLGGAAYFLLRGHGEPSTGAPPDPSASIRAPLTASHAPMAVPSPSLAPPPASGAAGAAPASPESASADPTGAASPDAPPEQ